MTICEGARSFTGPHATVTLQPRYGAPIDFSPDECAVPSTVCALALITNTGGDLVVQREARYLVPARGAGPQRTTDRAYPWGMNRSPAGSSRQSPSTETVSGRAYVRPFQAAPRPR